LDPALRTKLLAETIAPWRSVRLFACGSLGSGAALGGFLTLAGLLAAKSGARSDVDIDEATANVAIDFAAAAIFAVAAYFDSRAGGELNERVAAKLASRKSAKVAAAASGSRVRSELASLPLLLSLGPSAPGKPVAVRDVQAGAGQALVLLAGPPAYVRDCLLAARLVKPSPFSTHNALVVPFETTPGPGKGGFGGGGAPPLYVATPGEGVGW
ncbi:hypothetical protein TeGR_g1124, partial [Tetraparma gracilis]